MHPRVLLLDHLTLVGFSYLLCLSTHTHILLEAFSDVEVQELVVLEQEGGQLH